MNGKRQVEDGEEMAYLFMLGSYLDKKMEDLVASPVSSVDRQAYKVASRIVTFKPLGGWIGYSSYSLADFSNTECQRLFNRLEALAERVPLCLRMDFRVEMKIEVEELNKVFSRTKSVNEPSSDQPTPAATPGGDSRGYGHQTRQLLAEKRATERVEILQAATDWQSAIIRMWECRELACRNFNYWCYIHQPTQEHFAVSHADVKSWARKIFEGVSGVSGVSVNAPPPQLIEY